MGNQSAIWLNYIQPVGLCGTLLCVRVVTFRRKARQSLHVPVPRAPKNVLFTLQCLVLCLLLASCATGTQSLLNEDDPFSDQSSLSEAEVISSVACVLFFAAILIPTPNESFNPDSAISCTWLVAALFEIGKLAAYGSAHGLLQSTTGGLELALGASRALLLILMFLIHLTMIPSREKRPKFSEDGECAPLLEQNSTDKMRIDAQSMGWLDYFFGFRVFFPYIWPSDSRKHQLLAALCFVLLLLQRVINILVPYQLELVVVSLSNRSFDTGRLALYVICFALQGQQGIIGSIRAILWIPISQRLFTRLSCDAFEHVLSLSLDFHLHNKMGEVIAALSKGGALNTFFDGFVFQLFPMVLDLVTAAAYVFFRFNAVYSLIIVGVLWGYIVVTINMAIYRGRARRQMADADRAMNATKADAMIAYETVQYNSALDIEGEKFQTAVNRFQSSEYSVLLSLNTLNVIQNSIFSLGVALVAFISAYQISQGTQSVAMFVALLSYFSQIHAPLAFFGSFFNQVQNNLVDAERMLDLFTTDPTIKDSPDALSVSQVSGTIRFENVDFAYNGTNTVLHNVSFVVEPGSTTAIVGESGSGKSTCMKLLFRFYDPVRGKILMDDNDIRHIRLKDLRKFISVVPQQQDLFHTTIADNVRYSKPEALHTDIEHACRVARIHDRILSFPEKYETVVGERGLRLSGGEKQRIALARALLKESPIILLDEATSSLDSRTESEIQLALEYATKGRTTIVIAHRLSTTVHADQILVLDKGEIVERGSHTALLNKDGLYKKMWDKQIQNEELAESTKVDESQ